MLESDSDRSWRGLRGGESPDMSFSAAVEVHPRSQEALEFRPTRSSFLLNAPKYVKDSKLKNGTVFGLNKVSAMMLVSPE